MAYVRIFKIVMFVTWFDYYVKHASVIEKYFINIYTLLIQMYNRFDVTL